MGDNVQDMIELNEILNEFYDRGGEIEETPTGGKTAWSYKTNVKYITHIPPYKTPDRTKSSCWEYRKQFKNEKTVLKRFSIRKYGFEGALARALREKRKAGYEIVD